MTLVPQAPDSHPQPKWQPPLSQGEATIHFDYKGALWTRASAPPALIPALTKAVTPTAPEEKPQVTPALDLVPPAPILPPAKAVVPTASKDGSFRLYYLPLHVSRDSSTVFLQPLQSPAESGALPPKAEGQRMIY